MYAWFTSVYECMCDDAYKKRERERNKSKQPKLMPHDASTWKNVWHVDFNEKHNKNNKQTAKLKMN